MGIRTITEPCYVDALPTPDRTPAPVDEVEAFLAKNTFQCALLAARITPEQCDHNRHRPPVQGVPSTPCHRCTQERPGVSPPAKRRGRPPKSESPWRKNPGFIPTARRPEAIPSADETAPPPVAACSLEFTGPDAEIVRAFAALSRADGHDPAADAATILDLFMSGQLRLAHQR